MSVTIRYGKGIQRPAFLARAQSSVPSRVCRSTDQLQSESWSSTEPSVPSSSGSSVLTSHQKLIPSLFSGFGNFLVVEGAGSSALAMDVSTALDATVASSKVQTNVPKSLGQAMLVFCSHKSPVVIVTAALGLIAWRVHSPSPLGVADLIVVVGVVSLWLMQEWFAHIKLLHSTVDWIGSRYHLAHHEAPYFHVCIDGLDLILPAMVISGAFFHLLFLGSSLAQTATATYFLMGLGYEWTHFLVHTRVAPSSKAAKRIRQNHMLHHCRNENYWLSFMVPQVDHLFGTCPEPGSVPMTPMAKATAASRLQK